MIRTCITWLLVASLLAPIATMSSAGDRVATCAVAGLTAIEAIHPQRGDLVGFEIALGSPSGSPYRGPPQLVLARVSGTTDLRLDVVLTADAARFPGFTRLEVRESGSLRPVARPAARGTFGPFTVGEHEVTTVVHVVDDATGALEGVCDPRIAAFNVYPDSGLAPVVEFFHAASDRYFVSQDVDEINTLDRNPDLGWKRTGYDFLAYRPDEGDLRLQRIARYRSRSGTETGSALFVAALGSEALDLTIGEHAQQWQLDLADAFEVITPMSDTGACPASSIAVYRMSNRTGTNQRLTIDRAIGEQMIANGWIADGIAWCAVAP